MAEQLEIKAEGLEPSPDTRLSYSSASLMRGCEQRYYYYKVAKIDIDPDASKDSAAFNVGKAFHYILEESKHVKPAKMGPLLEDCVKYFNLQENEIGLVHAMVLKYLRLRSKQNMRCVGCEYVIKSDLTVGFVDLIEEDLDTGLWWISDMKTAKTFYPTTVSRLPMDRQLNLYTNYMEQIAEAYGLDPKKFGGCRYKVTTKSSAKQRKNESYNEYVMRLVDSYIKSYDIIVPKEKLNPKSVMAEHKRLHKRSLKLREGAKPTQNFGYCESYFKPCEYWSNCHGKCFSDMKVDLEVIEEI